MPLSKIDNTQKDIYTLVAAEIGTATTLKLLKNYEWDIPQIISDILSASEKYKSKIKMSDEAAGRLKEVILGDVEGDIERFTKSGVKMITLQDREYPKSLRKISNPPLAIFVKGELPDDLDRAVSVVGSRSVSKNGLLMANELGVRFARQNIPLISGMAVGVDGAAQNGIISAGGQTVAVLGSGVNYIYPPVHTDLYHNILANGGAVVSELTPYRQPTKLSFPIRNRLISGLSRGVIIVEPRSKSGALITLDYAVKQGKIIYILPVDNPKISKEEAAYYYEKSIMVVPDVKTIIDNYVLSHELLADPPQIDQHALKHKQLSLKKLLPEKNNAKPAKEVTKEVIEDKIKIDSAAPVLPESNEVKPKKIDSAKKAKPKSAESETTTNYKNMSPEKDDSLAIRLTAGAKEVFNALNYKTPTSIDAIHLETGLGMSELMSILLVLELNNLVHEIAPDQYILLKS